MDITINKKNYSLKFGVKFVRKIDTQLPLERDGIKFGMGLVAKVIPELTTGNTNTLSKVILWANETEKPKLDQDMVDNYIDDCTDIEKLFDEVLGAIKESNSGKLAMRSFEKAEVEA